MSPRDFEIAFYALTVWRISRTNNIDENLAVASVIRNHVIPRLGQIATYPSFYAACLDFQKVYPLRDMPDMSDPAFVAPEGLLYHITRIYDCTDPDVTSTHDHPNGAKYFLNEPSEWFTQEIINRPDIHPLIGSFGGMQFYE